ncbi:N-6 DNA methylase [Flavobacteriales bacterium]|nr:N-6 DNA methylase [Flavobacteriales bacterium]
MAIFQKSVVEKFLNELEESIIDSAYSRFKEVYSASRINEIKTLKEEQYQEGFVRDIFAKVLGYTLQPESNYDIELEKKNETDSKKADGAILKDGNVIGVIELKDNKTKSLDKVKDQAFGYKVNHKGCKYVITSNFQKLRLYIDDATEYEEFDLYSLEKEEFARLYLFLAKESLIDKNLTDELKEKTKFHEEDITKKLYKDYSSFKYKFYANVVKNNPQYDKLILFKKSQKFLDRILFILFSEDKKLIPENAISKIVESWEEADDLHYKPLYKLFQILFTHLDKGHKYKSGYEIPAYNGGLFIADEVLDNIEVDDEVLKNDLLILSKYDFNTEVDVNILGHIFEHSLTELEEAEAEIKGDSSANEIGKRKKDGVFYTPKHITKYIVDNTIGKLCNAKKEELNIEEFDVREYQNKNGKVNSKGKELFNLLESYKKWLFELKILDPACGSGAFLNQALTFLINEHKFIDDLIAELTNAPLRLFDTDKAILEKNIFGVDINEESVEIAKLSLWLRTAQKGRKLSNLSGNIKCGNSLVNDEIAKDKAFNWKEEFSAVFAEGGFDVIIGNPPYVSNWTLSNTDREMVEWLSKEYKKDLTGHWDLFICFISISITFLKTGGYNSFILPTSFLKEKYAKLIRQRIINEQSLVEIVDFGEEVIFENVARQTFIYNIKKSKNTNNHVVIKSNITENGTKVPQGFFRTLKNCAFKTNVSSNDIEIYNKITSNSYKLGELFCINVGVVAHSNSNSPVKFKKDDVIHNEYKQGFKKYVIGPNLSRYSLIFDNQYLDYEANKNYFHRPKFNLLFESDKIVLRRTSGNNNSIIAYFDTNEYYTNDSIMHLVRWSEDILQFQKPDKRWKINLENQIDEKFILTVLCSKLITYYFSKFLSTDTLQGAYSSIYPEDVRDFPIIKADKREYDNLSVKAEEMQKLNISYQKKIRTFIKYLSSECQLEKVSKKLQKWYMLEFGDFIKEINKGIKKSRGEKLSKADEIEWLELFDEKKEETLILKSEIEKIDKEIDQMVYELYGLTNDEIKIVEDS